MFYRTIFCFGLFFGTLVSAGEPDQPLFEKMPFDRLTLTPKYNRAAHDVLPISFETGFREDPLPSSGNLLVRLVRMPHRLLQVAWYDIEKIDLFFELVYREFIRRLDALAEEVQQADPENENWDTLADRFEVMFDYLRYLNPYREDLPGFEETEQKLLFTEGVFRIRSKDYLTGSARFERLFEVNKEYPDLEKNWADALDTLLKEETLSGNEAEGRHSLEQFRRFYPKNPVVETWDNRLKAATRQRYDQSKKAFDRKEYLTAHVHCEMALRITADLPEVLEWKRKIFSEAPRIDIAVTSPGRKSPAESPGAEHPGEGLDARFDLLPDWETRRVRLLAARMLCHFRQPSLQGGVYDSPPGTLEKIENNRKLRWTFSKARFDAFRLNVYDVADTVLFFSSPDGPVETVEVNAPDRIEVRLRRRHLIPESLFTVPVRTAWHFALPGSQNDVAGDPVYRGGLFEWKQSTGNLNGFELSPQAAEQTDSDATSPPKVVFEHAVQRGEEAVELLLAGKVDMIDRLPPWELRKFRGDRNYITGQYAVPTIHFLVPNMRKPLVASRTFRRALLYGLNRTAMLGKLLENGGRGEVSSVPFIKGASMGDPLGYGYDNSIRPRPYEPKLAIALSLLAFDHVRSREPGWEELEKMPTLVLARPNHGMAEDIALMIRRQWEAIGVPVRVVEYRENEPIGRDEEIDLWLVDRVVLEPLVDASRIFGHSGLLGHPSPYMELALEKLRVAEDWPTAGRCLNDIHRLCFEETTVLPLWQISEHYVHRLGIDGLGEGLFELYRNILQWTVLPK